MKKLLVITFAIISILTAAPAIAATPNDTTTISQSEENHGEVTATDDHSEAAAESHEENTSIVGMFGLNWKLFLAQLANFAIILFILWKWVFGPVTAGLTKRTERIETALKDAERITNERQEFDTWKQAEIAQARTEAADIINKAKTDAESLKAETVNKTKEEQQAIVEQTRNQLAQEKAAVLSEAKSQLADIVVSATEKIIKEKLDSSKDKQLIQNALKQVGDNA